MNQLDAFLYFLVNLALHNAVLVAVALLLGLVLGKLMWGKAKLGMDSLRERVKNEETRVEEAEAGLVSVREEFEDFKTQVEAAGDGPVVVCSPELKEEVEQLRKTGKKHEELAQKAAADLEKLTARVEAAEVEKKNLEEELAKQSGEDGGLEKELQQAREEIERLEREGIEERKILRSQLDEVGKALEQRDGQMAKLEEELKKTQRRSEAERTRPALPPRGGRAVDLERAETAKAALEKELEVVERERDQVEEASAILRQELYGVRSKLEAAEKREEEADDLAAALQAAEAKLERLEGTVAKDARVRKDLERRLEEADGAAAAGGGNEEAARGAAADLRGSLEEAGERPAANDDQPEDAPGEDLKRIKGIGTVLEQKLKARGVRTLRQIADWSDEEMKEISKALNLRNRAERGDWRGQARALCGED